MSARIEVRDSSRGGEALVSAIVAALRAAMRFERRPMRLSLALVGDAEMRRLNRIFHGVDAPTDVLAFPLGTGLPTQAVGGEGEVVVSLATARREARARRVPLAWEASLYAVHGYLHLCGYDDHRAPDTRAMASRTLRILRGQGIEPKRLGITPAGIEPQAVAAGRPAGSSR